MNSQTCMTFFSSDEFKNVMLKDTLINIYWLHWRQRNFLLNCVANQNKNYLHADLVVLRRGFIYQAHVGLKDMLINIVSDRRWRQPNYVLSCATSQNKNHLPADLVV